MFTQTHRLLLSRYDTAQQETHIPDLPTVEAALRLKAAEEIKRPLSHHTSGLIIYSDETVETTPLICELRTGDEP